MNTLSFTSHFVEIAVQEAKKSTHLMKMGCVIFKGKTILSKGYNRSYMPTHTKDIPMCYLKWRGSLHAEMAAIFSAFERKKNLQGASLLVVRINNQNQFRVAKPCVYCQHGILDLTPIKKVYYSVNEYPYIIKENLKAV